MRWFDSARARLRLLFARRAAEHRMNDEFRFHIEMETDKLMRARSLTPDEARRQALAAFGGVEKHKEALRDGRGLAGLRGMSLDCKLATRMLLKYPGLTIVGGLAMAFAICVGTVIFEVLWLFVHPTLPLSAGERIVQIRNWDVAANKQEPRALHDFVAWRGALQSVTELGAWQDVTRNLIVAGGEARPVEVAEMTASGFRIAQGTPLLGRVLVAADERPDAPPVAILGYELWRTRFAGDVNVLGRTVQLGNEHATVVGVMREGFAFPVAHELWVPFRTEVEEQAPRSGPPITIFGTLAPGATFETAQAELTTLGRRAAIEMPATDEHLQPRVVPYATLFFDPSGVELGILFSFYVFAVMLLVLVCSNVALLLFARAATRESELVMRTALGASRSRIVAQLFVEALVLGGVAAVAGLAAAQLALHNWGLNFLELNLGRLPFWFDLSLSPATVLFAVALTVLGSAIAGVMPGLKVTRGMGSRLKQAVAGSGGLQFGGVWTAVIVAQVAVTVAFPAIVYVEQWQMRRIQTFDAGFATGQYLGVRIQMDASSAGAAESVRNARRAEFATAIETLRARIEADPGITGVTFVDGLPATNHTGRYIEVDGARASSGGGESATERPRLHVVRVAAVDPTYFDVLQAPILSGRAFRAADATPNSRVAIVDQGFVDQILEGRNPIGQHVRFVNRRAAADAPPEPWLEVVGVVKELGMGSPIEVGRAAGFYVPGRPELLDPAYIMVHVNGDPMARVPQLREMAAAVNPMLRLSEFQQLDAVNDPLLWIMGLWIRVSVVISAVALLLSLAGIYAVLSFTVARRTREIGLRVAVGASPLQVVAAIFRRPLLQVGLGILAGGALIVAGGNIQTEMPGLTGELSLTQYGIIVAYAAFMLAVCLVACVVPTRRALRVEPTIALRAE